MSEVTIYIIDLVFVFNDDINITRLIKKISKGIDKALIFVTIESIFIREYAKYAILIINVIVENIL